MEMKRELFGIAVTLGLFATVNMASAQTGSDQHDLRGPSATQQLNNKEQDQGIKSGQMGQTAPEPRGETPKSKQGIGSKDKDKGDPQTTQNSNPQPRGTIQQDQGAQSGMNKLRSTEFSGQGSAKSVQLSQEQRSKIHATISNKKVERVTNVNFSVAVGVRVPRTVPYYPLPLEVVEIVPEYRGYDYILFGDEIVIIDPVTFEIVAVLLA
jgi:hypothetical protein